MERISLSDTQKYLKKVIEDIGDIAAYISGANYIIWNVVNMYAANDGYDCGRFDIASGVESNVFVIPSDINHVYKEKATNDRLLSTSPLAVYAYNQLFPESYYEFLGFVYTDRVRMLLRQPYYIRAKEVEDSEIFMFLIKRGFTYIGQGSTNRGVFQKGVYRINDVIDNSSNSLKYCDNIYIIDARIYFMPPEPGMDAESKWREYVLEQPSEY